MIRLRLVLFCCLYGIGIISARAQVPVPDFSASIVAGCGPLNVNFKDLSSGNPISWTWDFGNGQISNQQNPSVVYRTPGTYTVVLIAKNTSGASSIRKTDYITVYSFPIALFSADLTVGCAPASIQFTDHSTPGQGTITSWTWKFGDGTTSNEENPSHIFTQTGYYDIALTVVNSGGCGYQNVGTRFIRVVPGVAAAFSPTQNSPGCGAPFSVNFINQTAGPGTLSYVWDLGNGTTSTQTTPTTTYPTGNPYTVTLTANSSLGCSNTTTKTVSFQGGTPLITAPAQACVNTTVNFQNGSSPAPVSSSWDFGDGSTASVANPSKSYTTPGTYTVTLTNTYPSCTSTATWSIQIINGAAAAFKADNLVACKAPFTVNFTDLTPGATSGQWDFGDGTIATDLNPAHTYTTPGNFTVTLTSNTSAAGCTAVATNVVRVSAPTIILNVVSGQGCIAPSAINPTATINAVDGVATYNWSSPAATSSSNTTTARPSFTYPNEGTYDLSLTITTKGGCTASQTFTNGIHAGQPVNPIFTADNTQPCVDQTVTFTSAFVPNLPVGVYAWNFGDDSTSRAGSPVQHIYKDTGYQDVSLTINRNGCVKSYPLSKYIHVNAPLAGFSYKIIDCSNRSLVTFTDTSEIDPTMPAPTFLWDFGDGTTSTAQTPPAPHVYPPVTPIAHKYTVTLTVSVPGGCSDTRTAKIDLLPVTPSFKIPPDSACKNDTFMVTSTSTPAAAIRLYSWSVDGPTPLPDSSQVSYKLSLPTTGDHTIFLTVTDSGGCTFTAPSQTINIIGPTAKFMVTGGCRNSPIQFTDQSTPYTPAYPLVSWVLDGGDGTQPTIAPPFTHSYTDIGSYTAILNVKDSKGCIDRDTARTTKVQITAPHASFFAEDTVYCPNAPLPFTDSSQGNNLTYTWDFGDGVITNPALTTPGTSHSYATDAKYYSVKLKITDGTGCSDSVTLNNYIHIQSPIAAFTQQDSTAICLPLQTTFLPAGQYYDSLYWSFGDGTTSNLDTTTHFYNSYGTFHDTLFLKGAGGCVSFTTQNVYLYNPNTATSITYNPPTGCDSFVVNFQLTPPPYTRFTLYFGDGPADSSGNKTPSHNYNFPSTYRPILGLQDSTGCIVNIAGTNNIIVYGAIPFFNMNEKNFCDNGTVFFTDFTITNDAPVTMTWSFGDGGTATGTVGDPNTENPSYNYTIPGLFRPSLTLNTTHGCSETYTDTVHVYQTPHPLITAPGTLCVNTPLQFQGSLTTPVNSVDTVNWTWNFDNGTTSAEENPLISYSKAGTYRVSLRTFVTFGCSDTISQPVTINPLPSIKGPSEITTPVGIPVAIPFTYSSNVTTWSWSPPADLSCFDCPNPAASSTFKTLYVVQVTDINNCVSSDSIVVRTICDAENYFIPNTFSPNNDGVNDVFYPRGKGLYNIQSMQIFNRWGQKVFERKDFPANTASNGWDGTINGRPAPSDAYVYIIEVVCNNAQVVALKGDITLIR